MAKKVAKFESKIVKFKKTKNIKTFYNPNILNTNGLKTRKNQKDFILPPSGVLKKPDNHLIVRLFVF